VTAHFRNIAATWFAMVRTETFLSRAIARFEWPSITSVATARSAAESASNFGADATGALITTKRWPAT
jgi:hypothetical protein